MKKLLVIVLIPGVILALMFLLWGDAFEAALNQKAFIENYSRQWAWLALILLLVGDLFYRFPHQDL